MTNNKADVLRKLVTKKKGEPGRAYTGSSKSVPVNVLIGDGLAKVGRERRISHGIGYGEFGISGSCYVEIKCNQDEKTIGAALRACQEIADAEMERDEITMLALLQAVKEELSAT